MKIMLIILVVCLSAVWCVISAQESKENPVKINVQIPKGSEKFQLKADRAWRNLFAGTQNNLPDLLEAVKNRKDIVVPESVNMNTDPKRPHVVNPNVIEVKKQTADPQLDDCTVLRELRKIVDARINPSRKVTWQLSGKPHPCLKDEGFAKL